MTTPEFAIVGAGPTGSALATWLARAGRDVLLLDRTDPPQVAVGESLIPACASVLAELGVSMDGFQEKHGAVFTRGGASVRFPFADALRADWPLAWQTPRADLDARVRAVAREAGARFEVRHVTGVRPRPDGLTLLTDQGPLNPGFVIDAGGRGQLVARALGLNTRHPRLRNAAMGAWHRGVRPQEPDRPGDVTICAYPGGWFWFIPFADGHWSVGTVLTPDGPRGPDRFAEALARCPDAAVRLEGAERLEPFRGASDISVGCTRMHGPGWALAGDAATFLDPIFSTGLALGLNGGRALARALLDGSDLDRWEAGCRAAVQAFEPLVDAFYDGRFLDVALADRALQQPTVRQAIISLLAGDVFDDGFPTPRRFGARFPTIHRMVTSVSA